MADLEARAGAELTASVARVGDEMRGEIGRIVQHATERVVAETLDPATDAALIDGFIQRVGAS